MIAAMRPFAGRGGAMLMLLAGLGLGPARAQTTVPNGPGTSVIYPDSAPIVATPLPPPPGMAAGGAGLGTGGSAAGTTAAAPGPAAASGATPQAAPPPAAPTEVAVSPAATPAVAASPASPPVAAAAPTQAAGTMPAVLGAGGTPAPPPAGAVAGGPVAPAAAPAQAGSVSPAPGIVPGTAPGTVVAVPGGAAQTAAQPPAPPAGTPLPATWIPRPAASLLVLNKVTAVAHDLAVPVGKTVKLGTLAIAVQACVVRPPDMPGDAAAFLDITGGAAPFRSWMLKNEPSLSIFQDPTYDVQVRGCGA